MKQSRKSLEKVRNLIGCFIENEGADAVVVVYSKVKNRKTETYIVPYGNAHTCYALVEYTYENFLPSDLTPEEEIEDAEDDDE
tara:strand:- start:193 stop:441 length:249 start_codon:yes stop_codon:yes gene_type:complete